MVIVDNVTDFAKKNEEYLRLFLTNRKGIFDPELVNDIIQNFYVRIIRNGSLEKYDPDRGNFKTYIMTILCNMLPHEKRRNPLARYSHLSSVPNQDGGSLGSESEVDVFDFIYGANQHQEYGIAQHKDLPSKIFQQEEDECTMHMMAFIEHIKKSEPNKVKAEKMVCYVENRMDGCKQTDVAKILGVSDNMVKIMKNNIYDKYKKWDSPKVLDYV